MNLSANGRRLAAAADWLRSLIMRMFLGTVNIFFIFDHVVVFE